MAPQGFQTSKTTLMDVLSLRKSSGEIQGDVRLNGHPQEPFSFRRCTGYGTSTVMQLPSTYRNTSAYICRQTNPSRTVRCAESATYYKRNCRIFGETALGTNNQRSDDIEHTKIR